MKTNIAIILASKDFRDEEYFITKEVLEKQGNKIKSVSNEKRAIGRFGGEVLTDILIEELDIDNFDEMDKIEQEKFYLMIKKLYE
jgi:putative intracellular protease/amidase